MLQGVTLQLQSQAAEGGLLTEGQFGALNDLMGLLPQDRAGVTMSRMLGNELEAVAANDFVVSKNLPSILEYVHENLGDALDESQAPAKLEISKALRQHFGLAENGGWSVSRLSLHAPGRPTVQLQLLDANNTPVTRLLSHEFAVQTLPPLPKHFFVSGYQVRDIGDPRLPRVILKAFGRPIPPDLLLRVFSLDQVNGALPADSSPYVLDTLMIQREKDGVILMNGLIKTADEDYVGNFQIKIPGHCDGQKWIADGHDFNIDRKHRNRGLSTTLLRGFLVLLLHLGVEALEARARESKANPESGRSNSRYYYAKVGFNPDRQTLNTVTKGFLAYISDLGFLTKNRQIEISHFTEIWQIADYLVGDEKVGKAFLSEVLDETLTMQFQIRGDYAGWLRVMQPRPPLEWDALSPNTRTVLLEHFSRFQSIVQESLLSDERCGFHLADWVNNLSMQVALHLEYLDVSKRKGSGQIPRMGEMVEEMTYIADVLNMIAANEGQPLAFYFRKYLRTGEALSMVLKGIREREIDMKFEVVP